MEIYQERLLKILFVLIWGLALIHMTAEYYYLYWTLKWFDVLTHFLGGVWVGLAGVWFWYFSGYVQTVQFPKKILSISLLCGLLVGLVWEGYEYSIWQLVGNGLPLGYFSDSLLDLIMDCVGALFGYAYLRFRVLQPSLQTQKNGAKGTFRGLFLV